MAKKNKTSFEKGQGGRPKGSANKVTQTAKQVLADALEGNAEAFHKSMSTLATKNPGLHARVYAQLLGHALPKNLELSAGEGTTIHVKIGKTGTKRSDRNSAYP